MSQGNTVVSTWEQLEKVKSPTHYLKIDTFIGCGWVKSKTDKDDRVYLSTHSFYDSAIKGTTDILNQRGFAVLLSNQEQVDTSVEFDFTQDSIASDLGAWLESVLSEDKFNADLAKIIVGKCYPTRMYSQAKIDFAVQVLEVILAQNKSNQAVILDGVSFLIADKKISLIEKG